MDDKNESGERMAKKPAPQVTTTGGAVQGAWKGKGEIAVFRGVPYAAAPVGARRWKPPAAVEPWNGVRSATKAGPTAIQRASMINEFLDGIVSGQGWSSARTKATTAALQRLPAPKASEDCLHLTIRTPELQSTARLPVMVWIHGGDHQDGASSDVYYESNALAGEGVVTVAINYRLGLLGYMAHPELSAESDAGVSGNYGTLDQIAALEWVRDNISNFGGDPDNVTIFGESAGGESVLHMMTSPLARGLFHRAVPQSPANSGQMMRLSEPFLNYDSAEDRGVLFANALGITGNNQLPRLRELTVDQLYGLVRAAPRLGDHFPVIDGHVLPESPMAAFAGGRQAWVPLIIGSNADEGTLLLDLLGGSMVEYRHVHQPAGQQSAEFLEAWGDDAAVLAGLYPGLAEQDHQAEVDFLGDHMFGARAYWYAKHHARRGDPTWLYHFGRTPPSPTQTGGAYHAAELPFVHGSNVPIFPMSDDDKVLGRKMRNYWTSFAATADPNSGGEVPWKQFDESDPRWLYLNHQVEEQQVSRLDKYTILNARTQRLVDLMGR